MNRIEDVLTGELAYLLPLGDQLVAAAEEVEAQEELGVSHDDALHLMRDGLCDWLEEHGLIPQQRGHQIREEV